MTDLETLAPLLMAHTECAALSLAYVSPMASIIVGGGYRGETVAFLHTLHPTNHIFAYEPQIWAAIELNSRFKGEHYVHSRSYGLGAGESGKFKMNEFGTDACSFMELENSREIGEGIVVDVADEFTAEPLLDNIGLLVLNIEGYEHRLIPYMVDAHLIERCANVVVQVHEVGGYTVENLLRAMNQTNFKIVWRTRSWIWWTLL